MSSSSSSSSNHEQAYGINLWSRGYFTIRDGELVVNHRSSPALNSILHQIQQQGHHGPAILRFPHIIQSQIEQLHRTFATAIETYRYEGKFRAVFPMKVNQFPEVLRSVIALGTPYRHGLEAGSKAELILAMALTPYGHPIKVNGFKDEEIIRLGFFAAKQGHDITLTIEGIEELQMIIAISATLPATAPRPKIGIRLRLHSRSGGHWIRSSGFNSKFGLTSPELIEAIELLRTSALLPKLTMLHFHVGSQQKDITPFKRALKEAANVYADLKRIGATALSSINIGGGLPIEYGQQSNELRSNYSLQEFANDVVFLLKEVMENKGVETPDIISESGRFLVAHHAVCITQVLELFSQEFNKRILRMKESNPPLVQELYELAKSINRSNCVEFLHDALDHQESLMTLFNLGYIDLHDRANAEILVQQIIKQTLALHDNLPGADLECMQEQLKEYYLLNSSFFQSLPDNWGLDERFPVIPLTGLNIRPSRSVSLWDITCDSDGEISFDPKAPLYFPAIQLDQGAHHLAFCNVGAYQETLGMRHNLFAHPSEFTVEIDDHGFTITHSEATESVAATLSNLGYDRTAILQGLEAERDPEALHWLRQLLNRGGYLRPHPQS
ncbi:MAG: biosynthetic arginine decarboxylase [Gammaproteobacteria bacterium]|nr:biosynthetic arginine decarboxylase [Gammaproteobacteria bacterium]